MTRLDIIVPTHHKVGTVWMLTVFQRLAKANRFKLYNVNGKIKGWVIKWMLTFDRRCIFRDERYEDLIIDTDTTLWHELCVGMGLRGQELINALDAFWQSSIFGAEIEGLGYELSGEMEVKQNAGA